jgi:quinol monooxygenase YgiN
MYIIVAEFKIKPEHVATFARLVEQQAKDSVTLEADCHQFDVCQGERDSQAFLLYEVYTDKPAFEHHRGLPHTKKFLETVGPMIAERGVRSFQRR